MFPRAVGTGLTPTGLPPPKTGLSEVCTHWHTYPLRTLSRKLPKPQPSCWCRTCLQAPKEHPNPVKEGMCLLTWTPEHFKRGKGAPGSSPPCLGLSLGPQPASPVEAALIYINNCIYLEEQIAAQCSSVSRACGLSIGLLNPR